MSAKALIKLFLAAILVCLTIVMTTSCNRSFTASMGGGGGDVKDEFFIGGEGDDNRGNSFVVNGGASGYFDVESFIANGQVGEVFVNEEGYTFVIEGYREDGVPTITVISPTGEKLALDGVVGVETKNEEYEQPPVETVTLPDGSVVAKSDVTTLEDGSVAISTQYHNGIVFGHKVYRLDGSILHTLYTDSNGEACEYGASASFWVEYYNAENVLQKRVTYESGTMQVISSEERIFKEFEQYDVKFTYCAEIIFLSRTDDGYYKSVHEYLPDYKSDGPVCIRDYDSSGKLYLRTDIVYRASGIVVEKTAYDEYNRLYSVDKTHESGTRTYINYNEDGSIFNEMYYNTEGWMDSAKYYYHGGRWEIAEYRRDGSLKHSEYHYPDGKIEITEYDEEGDHKSGIINNADGTLYSTIVYEYNANKVLYKTYVYNAKGVLIEVTENLEDGDTYIGSNTTRYYDNGVVSEYLEYRNGELTCYHKYDTAGNKIG